MAKAGSRSPVRHGGVTDARSNKKGKTEQPTKRSKSWGAQRRGRQRKGLKEDWRREYYVAPDNVLRAARELMSALIQPQFDEFAGRMFAIQDQIDNNDLDKLDLIEQESSDPAFIEIVRAAKREALTGDPEQARTIAGHFAEEAFRSESATVALWHEYENRVRQRRIDAGYKWIEPPDKRVECECEGSSSSRRSAGDRGESRRAPVEISDREISLKFETDSGPVEVLVRY